MFKKYLLPLIIALVFGAADFYFTLPAINIKSAGFWGLLIFMAVVYVVSMLILKGIFNLKSFLSKQPKIEDIEKIKKVKLKRWQKYAIIGFVGIVVLSVAVIVISSSMLFNAEKYQKMLDNFYSG